MSRLSISLLAGAFLIGFLPLSADAQGRSASLPEDHDKELVAGTCTACHKENQITRSAGYTKARWKELFSSMIDLSASPKEEARIADYLAKHFPPNEKRASKLIPGPVEIAFREWKVPTLGQRARDPIEAADGKIWWAGQWGNLVGSIDPKTGEMKEYPLPDNSMPHSVTLDRAGNVWYTGNKNGSVGMLDPKTGKITVYKMPDPKARDPHTPIFDENGILWFTMQQSNMIGRLDPKTGDIKLVAMKTRRAKPYGIKIDKEGTPWVACNGSNCLVKVDPKTMELTEVKLPIPETTVRRLDIDSAGIIWYVNSSQGRLGRFDPKTGDIREWPSPSGPKSHPYGLEVVNDIVWYNESGVRPDPLVRFDPKTEKFQSWAIPSGGIYAGINRNMRATPDGNLLIHQTATNRIIKVTIKDPARK